MAYDPAARRQSNSALIIGIVSLMVVAGAALAYFATRTTEPPSTIAVAPVETRKETVVNNVPVPVPGPGAVIQSPPVVVPGTNTVTRVVPGTNTVTRVERNTTTHRERVVPAQPSGSSPAAQPAPPRTTTNTNITVNAQPAPSAAAPSGRDTAEQPASSEANSGSGNASSGSSDSGPGY